MGDVKRMYANMFAFVTRRNDGFKMGYSFGMGTVGVSGTLRNSVYQLHQSHKKE